MKHFSINVNNQINVKEFVSEQITEKSAIIFVAELLFGIVGIIESIRFDNSPSAVSMFIVFSMIAASIFGEYFSFKKNELQNMKLINGILFIASLIFLSKEPIFSFFTFKKDVTLSFICIAAYAAITLGSLLLSSEKYEHRSITSILREADED